MQQAVEQLTGEYRDELEHISDTVPHDRQEIEANDDVYYIRWQDVLAVFSSRVSGAEDGAPVAALDETRLDELREIQWDMNEVSYTTREETVEVPAQNANTEASRDTASESTANVSGAESQESNEADTTTITQTVVVAGFAGQRVGAVAERRGDAAGNRQRPLQGAGRCVCRVGH